MQCADPPSVTPHRLKPPNGDLIGPVLNKPESRCAIPSLLGMSRGPRPGPIPLRELDCYGISTVTAPPRLATDVRRLLDHLEHSQFSASSRTEIAATLYGSAHALDPGTSRASAVTHALRYRNGPLDERELWEAAGILPDMVSAPSAGLVAPG